MARVSTVTTPKTTTLSRVGTVLTIASVVVLAAVGLIVLFVAINGNVQLNSSDAVHNVFTIGVVVTILAGLLGLAAVVLHGLGIGDGFTTGKGVRIGVSVVALLVAVGFLFTTVLPRANAIQNLNNNVVPFALSLEHNCENPLNQTQADIKTAYNDAVTYAKSDQTFVTKMGSDGQTIQGDSTTLANAATQLSFLSVPDPKYQALLTGCRTDVKNEIALLNSPSALPFPPAVVAIVHIQSVSVLQLLQDSAAVASGQVKINAPDGSAEELASQVLQQVVSQNSDPTLTAEGNQLRADINSTLKDNLAPFVAGPSIRA